MSEGEFSLIDRVFKNAAGSKKTFTRLGIGDDASIHHPQAGMELVISTDSSVQGVHWPHDFPLDKAADRAVCSALSDLAAMGAEALCVWLNVMAEDSESVEAMGRGACHALQHYDIELAGGDTCRSSCNALSVTVAGQLPEGSAMRRDAAFSGDDVWLIGRTGLHALGLQEWISHQRESSFIPFFESIVPQLHAGVMLRKAGVSCCIDVSDGLLQDAGHIASDSGIGMDIEVTALPDWPILKQAVGQDAVLGLMAYGGEDYALLFTAPANMSFPEAASDPSGSSPSQLPHGLAVRIGHCRVGQGVRFLLNGEAVEMPQRGFDHFA